jgi:hypothetical protein
MTSPPSDLAELLRRSRERLAGLLGDGWQVDVTGPFEVAAPDEGFDEVWELKHHRSPRTKPVTLLIEAKRQLSPRSALTAAQQLRRYRDRLSSLGRDAETLFVAPWISARTQEVLSEEGLNYLDPTGNVSVRVDRPLVRIKTSGSDHSPEPEPRSGPGLGGVKAARLVRDLVDFAPPHRATELVERTGLSQGYVSKLLDALIAEALIKRDDSRLVVDADWKGLLRSRAQSASSLMRTKHLSAIARRGRPQLLDALRSGRSEVPVVLTGSWVANQIAPLAVGGPLMAYVAGGPEALRAVTKPLGLMRVDETANWSASGPDVILFQPPDDTPLQRSQRLDGLDCVAASQLVLDCLTGPGRMPAEGEAVLTWMEENLVDWRRPSPLGS